MKRIYIAIISLALSVGAMAQSGTNTPYSQFGLGILDDQSQGFNRAMDGLGIGMRAGGQVNVLNPASYSSIDSITMIFDAGFSAQITNFKENGNKKNARNANFEYAVATFRLLPKVGVSLGILPLTSIGYDYSAQSSSKDYITVYNYNGNGGLNEVFLGAGWNLWKNLSLGFNVAYVWGKYERYATSAISKTYSNDLSRVYSGRINSYKLDFGAQWTQNVNKTDNIVVGAIFGVGHKMHGDADLVMRNYQALQSTTFSDTISIDNAYSLPTSFGVGASYNRINKFRVGFDYSLQMWGKLDYPVANDVAGNVSGASNVNNRLRYEMQSGMLSDRHKVTVGGEYIPNAMARSIFKRINYRMGVSYATSYYKVNGNSGPKEISVSAGFGIPITNAWNNRSYVNISAQWLNRSASGLISENQFRINIGLTFNERWFSKWKFE